MNSLRTTYLLQDGATATGALQVLYLDSIEDRLRPNLTFIAADGSIYFETNEIGLKGEAIDPSRQQAVVWGDSVVFGYGWGWPRLLDQLVPGLQFLNGGVEGNAYDQILRRAVRTNQEQRIALNIVLLGWHGYNDKVKPDLVSALRHIPNPFLVTQPTAFNVGMINDDISSLLMEGGPEGAFQFPGSPYSVAMQQHVFDHIVERNQILREVAVSTNLPLIDLCGILSTEGAADFRRDFFDYMHPRPSAYAKIARAVYEGLMSGDLGSLAISGEEGGRKPGHADVKNSALGLYRLPQDPLQSGENNGAVLVVTPEDQWAYALQVPANLAATVWGERFQIRLAVRVFTGRIGIGVETRDRSRFYCYAMTSCGGCDDWQVLELETPPLAECGWLVVNNAFDGGSSRAEVQILEIATRSIRTIGYEAAPIALQLLDHN